MSQTMCLILKMPLGSGGVTDPPPLQAAKAAIAIAPATELRERRNAGDVLVQGTRLTSNPQLQAYYRGQS
jgi:hypothetical protein